MERTNVFSPAAEDGAVHVRHGDVLMTSGEKNAFFYTLRDPVGIHARPAAALVELAKAYQSEIVFSVGEKHARADSIIGLMSLGAKQGTRLKIEASGEDAPQALSALRTFLHEHL